MSDTYEHPSIESAIRELLARLPDRLTLEQIANLDQFHAGGADAIRVLLEHVAPDMRVVDLGSGLGGPARLAGARGAAVLGIERSPSYIQLARELTTRCGLGDRVSFEIGDIAQLALPAASADRVLLVHVQMNLADKRALARSIAHVLAPGGLLLVWEVCRLGSPDLTWPLPWSLDGSDSHLVTSDELRHAFEQAGLTIESWEDCSQWTSAWFQRALATPPTGPALVQLLHQGPERVRNFARAIGDHRLAIVRGVARV
jgi:SAM-dependent methyltransferase